MVDKNSEGKRVYYVFKGPEPIEVTVYSISDIPPFGLIARIKVNHTCSLFATPVRDLYEDYEEACSAAMAKMAASVQKQAVM